MSQDAGTGAWFCYKCEARGAGDMTAHPLDLLKARPSRIEWDECALPEYDPLSRAAKDFLAERGIQHPADFGIVEVSETTRLLFPYPGPEGKVIYWSTRYYENDGAPKYVTAPGRHPLYCAHGWVPQDKVVIVEGILDAIATYEYTGLPTIALGGKALPDYLRQDMRDLAPGRKVLMLDPDALNYAVKLCTKMTHCKLYVPTAGLDPADLFGKHRETRVAERVADELRRILS